MQFCSAKCLRVCDAVFLSSVFIILVWICLSQSDSKKTQNTNKIKELPVNKFGKCFTYCHIMLINEWNLASSPLPGAPNWNKMCSELKVVKLFSFMCNSQTTKLPYNHISTYQQLWLWSMTGRSWIEQPTSWDFALCSVEMHRKHDWTLTAEM